KGASSPSTASDCASWLAAGRSEPRGGVREYRRSGPALATAARCSQLTGGSALEIRRDELLPGPAPGHVLGRREEAPPDTRQHVQAEAVDGGLSSAPRARADGTPAPVLIEPDRRDHRVRRGIATLVHRCLSGTAMPKSLRSAAPCGGSV